MHLSSHGPSIASSAPMKEKTHTHKKRKRPPNLTSIQRPGLSGPTPKKLRTKTKNETKQVPVTADLYFSTATSLWVLKLRLADLDRVGETRWEGPRGCAHLYGEFGAREVADAREFVRRSDDESWPAALAREGQAGWLV